MKYSFKKLKINMIFPSILLIIGLCLMIFCKGEQDRFGTSPSFEQICGFILIICSIFCFIAVKLIS